MTFITRFLLRFARRNPNFRRFSTLIVITSICGSLLFQNTELHIPTSLRVFQAQISSSLTSALPSSFQKFFGTSATVSSDDTTVSAIKLNHLRFGIPSTTDLQLHRDGYVVGYDFDTKQARWVSYHLTPASSSARIPRHDFFQEDTDVPEKARATLRDYRGSGYDRGHLAPLAAIDFSKHSMQQSFLLSNISPQRPQYNRHIWKDLESYVRKLARKSDVYVITGPAFIASKPIKYCGHVPVPHAFWKVIYQPKSQTMLAYYIPQTASNASFQHYRVSVDQLENALGYDFFDRLPDELEDRLER